MGVHGAGGLDSARSGVATLAVGGPCAAVRDVVCKPRHRDMGNAWSQWGSGGWLAALHRLLAHIEKLLAPLAVIGFPVRSAATFASPGCKRPGAPTDAEKASIVARRRKESRLLNWGSRGDKERRCSCRADGRVRPRYVVVGCCGGVLRHECGITAPCSSTSAEA